jgi:L-lactate dehydrogenase (cytochrome)
MLALGARACLLGRAWAYAVAAAGQNGVTHVLTMMRDEMRVALALTGSSKLSDLSEETLDS